MSVRRNSHPPPLPLMLANQHQQQNFAMPLNPPPLNVMIVNQLQHHHLELQQQQQPVARLDWSSLRFPQIKELTLCWCPQDEDSTIIILKDLLRSLPCLERLLVTDIPPLAVGGIGIGGQQPANVGVGTRARVARLLVQVLTDPNISLPHLSLINFPIEIGNRELGIFTERRYQFKALNLKLTSGSKSSSLKDFLNGISSSLTSLEISFPDGFFTDGVTFPAYSQMKNSEHTHHLQQVKDLTLRNFHGPLELLQHLKKLKTLTVNSAKFDSAVGCVRFLDFKKDQDHQLQCLITDSLINSGAIASLSSSFTLLRVIKLMGLDDMGLGVIYRNLPYISEMEIIKGKITDQGLSGVPIEVCKDMAETSTFLFVDPAKFRSDLFLGSLQYLKTLKLVCDDVTDISVVFGIVDCKNLESLTLHSPSISDIGLFKIADMMSQLRHLDVHQCENVSEEGKFYVKEKMQHFPITLILEANAFQKQKSAAVENSFRQVGFPHRGRCVRPERYGPDDEYDRLPLRERMFMAWDRRRRYFALRMIHRVGRAPGENVANNAAAGPIPPPPNDEELRMLMEMHPIFAEDDVFMNFGDEEEEGNNLNPGDEGSDADDDDEDVPTPPNERLGQEGEDLQYLLMQPVDGGVFPEIDGMEDGGLEEFALPLIEGVIFNPEMEPESD